MIPFTVLHNDDGDIDMSQGLRFTTTLTEYVVHRLDENLSFFAKEWFLDQRLGIPFFERIIGAKPDLSLLETLFRRAIHLTPGVGEIREFVTAFDRPTRKASPRFRVVLKDGELITQEQLRAKFVVDY